MATRAELEARVAKLEEQLDLLADYVGRFVGAVDEELVIDGYKLSQMDSDMALMWKEELADEEREPWLYKDWHLVPDAEKHARVEVEA